MLKPTIFLFLIKLGNKTKTRTDIKLANYSIDMIVGTTQKDWYNNKKKKNCHYKIKFAISEKNIFV